LFPSCHYFDMLVQNEQLANKRHIWIPCICINKCIRGFSDLVHNYRHKTVRTSVKGTQDFGICIISLLVMSKY
jgi:hypothetical protein